MLTFDDFPLENQPLRFSAGDPEQLTSNSWRVWAAPAGDVYLTCRDNYRQLKASLHMSGSWQFGFTQEAAAGLLTGGAPRHWEIWPRPDPQYESATAAFRLLFLPSEFALPEADRPRSTWEDVAFLSAGPAWHVFTIWITRSRPTLRHESNATATLAVYPLPSGEEVQVTFHGEEPNPEIAQAIAATQEQVSSTVDAAAVPDAGRLLAFGHGDDGARFLTELWFHRNDDGSPRFPVEQPRE